MLFRIVCRRALAALPLSLTTLLATTLSAADAHPRVAPFERFYSAAPSDGVTGGQLLLGELNCTSCHQADPSFAGFVVKKPAPILDTVGNRVRPQYLLKFLSDPQATKPGTTMPNVLATLPETERKEKVEAIVHFLASTGTLSESAALRQSVNRGEMLYHSIGCVACHDPRKEENQQPLPTSIILGTPSRKYTIPGLTQFLADPLAVRPGGRMPHVVNDATEARDIAAYLCKDLDISSGLQFAAYQGDWNKLPDFSKLQPAEIGEAGGFDVEVTKLKDHFALRFDGHIQIPVDGNYLFLLHSDDGSKLYIDGKVVIDNDGIHAGQQKRKQQQMKAGLHTVAVEFFEQAGGEELKVEFQGPSMPQQDLATLISAPPPKGDKPPEDAFAIDPGKAAKGREFFASLGCASCHELKQNGQRIASALSAPPLTALKAEGGCLESTSGKTPSYALSPRQKESLTAALAAVKSVPMPLTEAESITRSLVRFNCCACHQRGELGGVEDPRNPHFQSDMPEMGDEGRLPPSLTGVGAKLQSEWLKAVLEQGSKERPYMFTRMPRFGAANVTSLIAELDKLDSASAKPLPPIDLDDADKKTKAVGRRLVGGQAFGCIKCHTFAGRKSSGIQALSLTTMTRRLKPEWFHYYMQSPLTYRPGTRMPTPFPDGQTTLPSILDGSVDKQTRAMWAYLSDGDQAILPVGLVTGKMELIAYDEAIIYRNFIEGAGPRAIGVGYPEKLNLAWDANNLRPAMLWHGAFIDAAKHWNDRGAGFEGPLGDNILRLPEGVPLVVLADEKSAWPDGPAKEQGFQFRGYRLEEYQRPRFLYSLGDVKVEDFYAPVGQDDVYVMQRTIFAQGTPSGKLFFRAAVGDIAANADDTYKIDNRWTIRIKSSGKPLLRESGGRMELLVPVVFENGKCKIVQEFDW
jgi:mono/diheme cytochrome c family protein